MQRLTEHHANEKLGAYMVCSGACIDDDFDCNGCENLAKIVDRLAAYEDTDMAPEEITDFVKRWEDVANLEKTNADYIRNMTDEELAALLCSTGWRLNERKECLEWLKSEKEEW